MKFKTLLVCGAIVLLAGLSACSSGYTCPTYMKDTSNKTETEVMVKLEPKTNLDKM